MVEIPRVRSCFEQFRQLPIGYYICLLAYVLTSFGSPMPSEVSVLEIVIGGGLLIGGLMLIKRLFSGMARSRQGRAVFFLLLMLLITPLLISLSSGYSFRSIMRDVIPLFFLLGLPVLFVYSINLQSKAVLIWCLNISVVLVGAAASTSYWVNASEYYGSVGAAGNAMRSGLMQYQAAVKNNALPQQSESNENGEMPKQFEYLGMYDPAVLYSCIMLCSWGVILIARSWSSSVVGGGLLAAGALMAYEILSLGLRSYALLIVLALLIVAWRQSSLRGFRTRLVPIGVLGVLLFLPQIGAMLHLLWVKQMAVGTNGKVDEWAAVVSTLSQNWRDLMFGIGWGGTFENPIISAPSRFTHSLVSFYLLKSGLLGLAMLMLIIIGLYRTVPGKRDWKTLSISQLVTLVAGMSVLAIGLVFEPTYKMLSFGVILSLVLLSVSQDDCENGSQRGQS